ncbi:MAG: PSD1 and planctomycete cytochrome C domain-containing protein, partial [Planctomycetota bacterium]
PTAICVVVVVMILSSIQASGEEPIRFNRDIRPILSDNCFYCHGPDRNKRQADLRLDTEAGLHGSDGNAGAIVPGNADASEMVQRILSADPDERMPPPESGKSLSQTQIQLLRRWIQEGGQFEGHWSFMPRATSSVLAPHQGKALSDLQASATIDRWVAQGLESQGLTPTQEADKVTLLRRLHFDLIGLPPSEAEVAEFLHDDSPNAYERCVDRLLASPHFGERMAIWWLDLVRYADSVGYHGDQEVSVSPFRQYVIDAFNRNMPFDQFTIEQLAGDLLPSPTRMQQIASGYNRLGMMSAEGGVQDKEYLAKYMAERVRNASGTWLGITLGCAECHDHKFDPLSTKDFYRFGAFFADIKEKGLYAGSNASGVWGSSIKVPTPEQEARRAELVQQRDAVLELLTTNTPELDAAFGSWESSQRPWVVLKPEAMVSVEGVSLKGLPDGSILADGKNPSTDTYILTFRDLPKGVTALRLEVLPDDSLPRKGPGRAGNGNFVLSEFVAHLRSANGETTPIALQNPSATYEQSGAAAANPYGKWSIAAALDADAKGRNWGWAIMEKVGEAHAAIFETASDLTLNEGESIAIGLWQNLDNPQHTIGRFRIAASTSPRPVQVANSLPAAIEQIVQTPKEQRSDEQRTELMKYFRGITPLLEPQRQQLAQIDKNLADLDASMTSTLVTEQVMPRMVRVLARGNWMDENGEVVTPAFPASLSKSDPPADRRLNRLDLAEWIVEPSNPLTTRVLSNRLWKLFFGAGLSRKLDDMGAQGEWPSHPELLDEISQWWIDTGWDVKRWVKIIVMSKTYRQSSVARDDSRDRDPFNRYLAHQSRFRLDAEFVRDNALAISGLLVTQIGGRSVRPYQPPGYWAYLNFPQREWQNGSGDQLYRRGLYTHWQRQYLHPSLLVFDAPNREECTADRPRSNTPLQSLALLNDPAYVEAARTYAESILRCEGNDAARIDYAMKRALSRSVTAEESSVLMGLLEKHRNEYLADPAFAKEVAANGARPAATDLDPVELAAWTSVARVILNLHETITRY